MTQRERDDGASERLQKLLSRAGIASRRTAETLIAQGRVSVNGVVVRTLGTKADPAHDDIRVDDRRLPRAERKRYVLLNKPVGYVSTRADPERRRTVIDLLGGIREYVYPVGRLDYDTEGLIVLTNDGDLAAALTHPRHQVPRTYEVRVTGMPDARAIDALQSGIPLDGVRTLPAEVSLLNAGKTAAHGVLRLTIREGRNRQVRRMCEAVGCPVTALKRIRIGPIADTRLRPGEWRDLTEDEITALRRAIRRPIVRSSRTAPSARRRLSGPGRPSRS